MKIQMVQKKMKQLEENLDVKSKIDLYFGTAFVVFNKQSDMIRAIQTFENSLISRAFSWIAVKLFKVKNKQIGLGETFFEGN